MRKIIVDISVVLRYWKESLAQRNISSLSLADFITKSNIILRCHHALLSLPEIYQPLLVPGLSYLEAKRSCKDRLDLISEDMTASSSKVYDLGCQIGFFSFSLAKKGFSIEGSDIDNNNIAICHMLNKLIDIPIKPIFVNIPLLPDTVHLFDRVDYVLCLSIFHHIIHNNGILCAEQLIRELRNKTKKKLYFEIGQSNEPVEPWAKSLPDMGSNHIDWIIDFLKSNGFSEIKVLGLMPTHVSKVRRYLVAAS